MFNTAPLTPPTPDNIKAIVKAAGLTREQAAALVHVGLQTMHNWCSPLDSQNHRQMPLAAWELLLIKTEKIRANTSLKYSQ